MKIKFEKNKLLILIIMGIIIQNIYCVKFRHFLENNSSFKDDEKKAQKVPIINVYMEEPDRDPLEVRRIEDERRVEKSRIREVEMMEEMDKRTFQQIIAVQNSQLAKLSAISNKSNQILKKLSNSDT